MNYKTRKGESMLKKTLLIFSFFLTSSFVIASDLIGNACDGLNPPLGKSIVSLQHEGKNRSYRLYVPKNYRTDNPTPLLINYHGTGSNAEQQALYSDMDRVADENNFIHVSPQGLDLDGRPVFNAGLTMQSPANKRDFSKEPRDDVDFSTKIIEDISNKYCVNEKKIYATGMSNGGRMSYRIGCDAADKFAAIAPVAGVLSLPEEDCQPSKPVPSIAFHGTLDSISSYYKAGGFSTMGALEMFSLWAKKNQCEGEPVETFKKIDIICKSYLSCKDDVEVKFCTVKGGGHCWPGRPCRFGSRSPISASDMIAEFLLRFERT
ncbi:MAG: hypothetical protein CL768_00265 [Chloroflexi bacterium]|nr:hypothetical protein [Chloroflexota bacterium]